MQDDWPDLQAALAALGDVNTTSEDEVDSCRLAAIDWITNRCVDFRIDPDDPDSDLALPDGVVRATLMLTARLFRRRESAEGVAGFGEFGAVRVTTVDPDIENLLAPYRAWGIA